MDLAFVTVPTFGLTGNKPSENSPSPSTVPTCGHWVACQAAVGMTSGFYLNPFGK